jgi:hypothetical protein
MKTGAPHIEEKLLEYAYGELSPADHSAVETHLRACIKCAAALSRMTQVRSLMKAIPQVPAPEAGLASLLAYAEQSAARAREDKPAKRPFLARYVMGLGSAAALVTVGVVAWRAAPEFRPVEAAMKDERQSGPPAAVAKSATPASPAPVVAEAPGSSPMFKEGRAGSVNSPALGLSNDDFSRDDEGAPSPTRTSGEPSKKGRPKKYDAEAPRESRAKQVAPPAVAAAPVLPNAEPESVALGGLGSTEPPAAPTTQNAVGPPPPPNGAGSGSSYGLDSNQVAAGQQAMPDRKSLPVGRASLNRPAEAFSLGDTFEGKAEADKDLADVPTPRMEKAKPAASDVRTQIREALAALARRPTGTERMEALGQLCQGYEAIGESANADRYCDTLAAEFPSSAVARARARRVNSERAEPSKPAAPAKPANR